MTKGIKVDLAKKIGFCFGVKRAIDISEAALKDNGKVYSLGSVIERQKSIGSLTLQSKDPHVQPRVQENFCAHDDDVRRLIKAKGLKTIPAVMQELEWKTSCGCAKCRPALNYYLVCDFPKFAYIRNLTQIKFIHYLFWM